MICRICKLLVALNLVAHAFIFQEAVKNNPILGFGGDIGSNADYGGSSNG